MRRDHLFANILESQCENSNLVSAVFSCDLLVVEALGCMCTVRVMLLAGRESRAVRSLRRKCTAFTGLDVLNVTEKRMIAGHNLLSRGRESNFGTFLKFVFFKISRELIRSLF